MTVIDPQREAYLKAVVERERYFYSHVRPHYCPSTDLRAYEVESNLPDKVLSALEEKNRLRSLWESRSSSPPQAPSTHASSSCASFHLQPSPSSSEPPPHFGHESISSDGANGFPVSTIPSGQEADFHGDDGEDVVGEVVGDDDAGSCLRVNNGLLVDLPPLDLSHNLDFP